MPNFVDCWNSLKAKGYKHADGSEVLNDQDRASIEARIQEHLRTGLDPIEAAKASVKSHLDEAHTQLQSIYDQVVPKPQALDAARVATARPSPTQETGKVTQLNVTTGGRGDVVSHRMVRDVEGNLVEAKPVHQMSPEEFGRQDIQKNLARVRERIPEQVAFLKQKTGKREAKIMTRNELSKNRSQQAEYERILRQNDTEAMVRYAGTSLNSELRNAVSRGDAVNAASVEHYGIELPEGYQKQGDLYVKPKPVSEAGQAPAVAGQPKIEGGTGEEVQKGQEGREAVLATERVQPPAPESPEALGEALKERPRSAGVANRVLQERAARGEIPQAPEAGEGHLTEDIINKSRQDYTPERALAAAENIKNGSTNEADAGQVRIHEENLTRVARDAEKALDADPKNPVLQQAYNAAKDNLSKWHNETVQPMKTQWSNIGKSMQGATDIDTGSYIGLQKLAWDTAKRDFTPQEEPVMRTAAKRVSKATDEVRAAIAKAEDHVQKVLKPSRYMDLNQLRESLAEKLKNITC